MKYKKKLKRIGSSDYVLVDKVIKNTLGIKTNDDVEVTLKKCKKGRKQKW